MKSTFLLYRLVLSSAQIPYIFYQLAPRPRCLMAFAWLLTHVISGSSHLLVQQRGWAPGEVGVPFFMMFTLHLPLMK
jgi:hypothetical protein